MLGNKTTGSCQVPQIAIFLLGARFSMATQVLLAFLLFTASLTLAAARSPPKPSTGTNSCNALPYVYKCDSSGYDKNSPPELAASGAPTPVKIQIYLENVGQYFSKATNLVDFDFYFVEYWNDTRLSHTNSRPLQYNSREIIQGVWQPDMYFANGIEADVHDVVVPNLYLKIQQNGLCRLSTRVHLKVPCTRDACSLKIVSYGNTKETLDVTWIDTEKPIQLNPEISDGELNITKTEAAKCSGAYFGSSFNCLTAKFYLKAA